MPRILGMRFVLTIVYKYLDIDQHRTFIDIGDNKGNQIILPYATWETFIARRADIEKLMQSTASASLSIRDLVINLVKIRDADIVKLTLYDTCMYMKPATILFLFELEHCINHVYFELCQKTHFTSEKFKHFVTILRRNCIIDKRNAEKILRKIYDKESNIECELIAYALDNIVYDAFHEK